MYSPNLVGLDIKNYLYNKEETRLKAGLPTSSIFARLASPAPISARLASRSGLQPAHSPSAAVQRCRQRRHPT